MHRYHPYKQKALVYIYIIYIYLKDTKRSYLPYSEQLKYVYNTYISEKVYSFN